MNGVAEETDTITLEKTGEFNTVHDKYVDEKPVARRTRDGSRSQAAHEERRNKGLALRDHYLRKQDLENSKVIDESLAGLERDHDDFVRQLRGI